MMQIISNILQFVCYLSYPFVYVYYRHFRYKFAAVKGLYCKLQIKHRGKNLRIEGMGSFLSPENIKIGDYCGIGENAYFHATGGLTIGNNVQISRNVTIYTASHNYHSSEYIPYDNTEFFKQVKICDNVWIGRNVSILPGVVIGCNAIIGMSAIITKDVPKNAIVVGHNRIIGYRDDIAHDKKLYGKEFFNG